jgi:hypothetical protein
VTPRERLDNAVKIIDDARKSTSPQAAATAERKLAANLAGTGRHRGRALAA